MKIVVLEIDGVADEPSADLGGKTPLEAARVPRLDQLAAVGILGLTRTIPRGTPPRADVGALSVLGYDPTESAPGIAVLEAIGCGVELAPTDVVYRVTLVRLSPDDKGREVLRGPIGGGLSDVESRAVFGELNRRLCRDGLELVASRGRHLLVCRNGEARVRTTSPWDAVDKPVSGALPEGPGAALPAEVIARSREVLRENPICAAYGESAPNVLWPWGQGVRRPLARFGLPGAAIVGSDRGRGLARLAGLDVVDPPGSAGVLAVELRGYADAAVAALGGHDFCLVEVGMADALGHAGDAAGKVGFVEQLDEHLVGPLVEGLRSLGGDWRIMVVPGHATPCARRSHSDEPVPFLVHTAADEGRPPRRERGFNERDAREHGIFIPEAHALMERLLRGM